MSPEDYSYFLRQTDRDQDQIKEYNISIYVFSFYNTFDQIHAVLWK